MPIQPCRLDQAHDRRCPFTAAQRPGEEPIRATEGPWSNLIFHLIVIDGHSTIIQVARQRDPAF